MTAKSQLKDYDMFLAAFHLSKLLDSGNFVPSSRISDVFILFTKLPCVETASNLLSAMPEIMTLIESCQHSLIQIMPEKDLGPMFEGFEQKKMLMESNLQSVSNIHTFLQKEAMANRARVGVHRMRNQKILIQRLKQIKIKKGLFVNTRDFLRTTIATHLPAFRAVADIICIHSVYDGTAIFWNGFGEQVDGEHYLKSEIMFELDLAGARQFVDYLAK